MSESVATKVTAARDRLDELGRLTATLAASHPGVFKDPALEQSLRTFERALAEAQHHLSAPTLRIATIGTTSSGKSTIVNALIGRRIAPIEAGEMSGGVLTLKHGLKRRLVVEASEGAPWESGTWEGISDADAYSRIRNGIMLPYHQSRRTGVCLAPQVLSEGPLLPSVEVSLLGLSSDVGVEFIDLPGLKSVQDRANLSVIQSRVHKAFCLVALDYMQTDEEHRKKLLEELSHAVRYLNGRTDSMLFVLNRVDQRGMDDEPIAVRLGTLRHEIKEVLGLQDEPDILPFESRLLYRAQCAWGVGGEGHPGSTAGEQQDHLKSLFLESASSLKRLAQEKPELRDWLRTLEDRIADGARPSEDDLRKLLDHARVQSGGALLWQRLRVRVEESFAELVILPALIDVFDAHHCLTDSITAVSRIRKVRSREQLENQRNHVEHVRVRLQEEVGATRERFRGRLTSAAEGLKTGDQTLRHRTTKELGVGFESLLGAVDEVTGDLTKSLIVPVRDALKLNRGVYDLEEQMRTVVDPAAAKELTHAYDLLSRRIPSLSRGNGTLMVKVRDDDAVGVGRLADTERDARRLYQSMRECLATRGEFTLQGQAGAIRGALANLLEQQADAITRACLADLPELAIKQAIESARRARSRSELLALPVDFFQLPRAIEHRSFEKSEVVGKASSTEHYTTGTCFKDQKTRVVSKNIMGDVAYQELVLPDEDAMARQWSDGVKGAEGSLWETLRDWMVDALRESSIGFSASIESVLSIANRAIEEQLGMAAAEYEDAVALWEKIDGETQSLLDTRALLVCTATSERQ